MLQLRPSVITSQAGVQWCTDCRNAAPPLHAIACRQYQLRHKVAVSCSKTCKQWKLIYYTILKICCISQLRAILPAQGALPGAEGEWEDFSPQGQPPPRLTPRQQPKQQQQQPARKPAAAGGRAASKGNAAVGAAGGSAAAAKAGGKRPSSGSGGGTSGGRAKQASAGGAAAVPGGLFSSDEEVSVRFLVAGALGILSPLHTTNLINRHHSSGTVILSPCAGGAPGPGGHGAAAARL